MSMEVVKNDIPTDTFTCNAAFGSNAGCDYGYVGWMDHSVSKMTFFLGRSSIGCIKVEKLDGTCITIGATPSGRSVTWNFEEGQLITRCQIFTNATTLAGVCLETKGKKMEVYIDNKSGLRPHEVMNLEQHGPGRLIGIFGNSDLHVESLGLAIERRPVSSRK